MDADTQRHLVDKENYLYALNFSNFVGKKGGFILPNNMQGNKEVTTYVPHPFRDSALPRGTNRCIGSLECQEIDSIIYFIWNKFGQHRIYQLHSDTEEIELLAHHDFGWKEDQYITGIDLVAKKLLYWTDNVAPVYVPSPYPPVIIFY